MADEAPSGRNLRPNVRRPRTDEELFNNITPPERPRRYQAFTGGESHPGPSQRSQRNSRGTSCPTQSIPPTSLLTALLITDDRVEVPQRETRQPGKLFAPREYSYQQPTQPTEEAIVSVEPLIFDTDNFDIDNQGTDDLGSDDSDPDKVPIGLQPLQFGTDEDPQYTYPSANSDDQSEMSYFSDNQGDSARLMTEDDDSLIPPGREPFVRRSRFRTKTPSPPWYSPSEQFSQGADHWNSTVNQEAQFMNEMEDSDDEPPGQELSFRTPTEWEDLSDRLQQDLINSVAAITPRANEKDRLDSIRLFLRISLEQWRQIKTRVLQRQVACNEENQAIYNLMQETHTRILAGDRSVGKQSVREATRDRHFEPLIEEDADEKGPYTEDEAKRAMDYWTYCGFNINDLKLSAEIQKTRVYCSLFTKDDQPTISEDQTPTQPSPKRPQPVSSVSGGQMPTPEASPKSPRTNPGLAESASEQLNADTPSPTKETQPTDSRPKNANINVALADTVDLEIAEPDKSLAATKSRLAFGTQNTQQPIQQPGPYPNPYSTQQPRPQAPTAPMTPFSSSQQQVEAVRLHAMVVARQNMAHNRMQTAMAGMGRGQPPVRGEDVGTEPRSEGETDRVTGGLEEVEGEEGNEKPVGKVVGKGVVKEKGKGRKRRRSPEA
ncbi:uncharacterized protein KY384_007370 [Bacidia gigantensis]|uniref:uncharacterized protein n=1 Tax=Bacidia gigantensis TaxID=2732470 RepID=UPI001D058283|nr:uncharacterized protein KY384_007370 [Bacidia gigantensis]KAG8528452.1 hypothetical protein KY384_007370 [Bacidia gigantensis]